MSITVHATTSGPDLDKSIKDFLASVQPRLLLEEAAKAYREGLLEFISRRSVSFEVTPEALVLWPFLNNLDYMFQTYKESIKTQEVKGMWRVYVDIDFLESMDLPSNLPTLLEFGDPRGFFSVPHWRSMDQRFRMTTESELLNEFATNATA